jgi:hypothetical protein
VLQSKREDRRDDDGRVADGVIARKQPDRAHIRISHPVRDEHDGRHDIDDKRDGPEQPHQLGLRLVRHQHAIGGVGEDAQTERPEEEPLDQSGAGTPDEAPADGEQAEESDQAVAEEIEGIGLQCLRARDETAGHLDEPISDVQQHHDLVS